MTTHSLNASRSKGGANNRAMYSRGGYVEMYHTVPAVPRWPEISKTVHLLHYMRRTRTNKMSFFSHVTLAFSYSFINSSNFWDTFITGTHLLSLYIPGPYMELEVILTELGPPPSEFPALLVPMNTTWTDIIAMVAANISIREASVKRARQAEKRAEKRRMKTSPYTGSTM